MYIEESSLKDQTISLSQSYYPKETVVLELDATTGLLIPSFMRVVKFVPQAGRKLDITVADNGYVVKSNNKVKVVSSTSYSNDNLESIINQFLNKEEEEERELTERELEDEDLIIRLGEMNGELLAD